MRQSCAVAMLQEKEKKATEPQNAQPKANESEVDLLKQAEVIIAQQKAAATTLTDLEASEAKLKSQLGELANNQLAEEPPYSITFVDQLRDSVKSLTTKSEAMQTSIMTSRDAVELARKSVEEKQRTARQLKEKNPEADLKVADEEVYVAEQILILRRQELAIAEASARVHALQLAVDQKKIEVIGAQVTFSKELLDQQIAEIEAKEVELTRKAELLQYDVNRDERRWMTARTTVDSTVNPGPELLERVDALKAEQQASQLELTLTNQLLQRLPMIRTAWKRRFLVSDGSATRDEQREWLAETVKQIAQLGRDRQSRQLKIDELRGTLIGVNEKLDATPAENLEIKRWLELKQAALKKQNDLLANSILKIDTATRTLERLRVQIEGERGRTLSEWIADAWSTAGRVWNFELTSTPDDVSITVGEVLSSILFLFFGFFAAKWISGLLARRLPQLGVDEAGTSVIESLSFYALLIAFGLTALRYANVPLTVFTFLGGAIAIGVGFGSQNILNNFISGLILLAERPIKVGDLIKLDETYGNVVKIGARSTQIRTGENLDIVVPNSKFLENNVTNLTRKDDRLRTSISVGVAYGSELDRVVVLLEQAANEAKEVQERPKPMVWFNDFGDNSLVFQVNFWTHARTFAQLRKVETEVRLNIDRLFREHKVVIAFPQRDLHIESTRPIELRLLGQDDADGLPIRAAG